eukprot:g69017.t1
MWGGEMGGWERMNRGGTGKRKQSYTTDSCFFSTPTKVFNCYELHTMNIGIYMIPGHHNLMWLTVWLPFRGLATKLNRRPGFFFSSPFPSGIESKPTSHLSTFSFVFSSKPMSVEENQQKQPETPQPVGPQEPPPPLPAPGQQPPTDPAKNMMARQYYEAAYQAALMQATQESMAQAGGGGMMHPMMAGFMGMPGFGMHGAAMGMPAAEPVKKRARGPNAPKPRSINGKKRKKEKEDGDLDTEGLDDVQMCREDLQAAMRVLAADTVQLQKGKFSTTYHINDGAGQSGFVFQKAKRPLKPLTTAQQGIQQRHRAQLKEMAQQILTSLADGSNFEPGFLRNIFGEECKAPAGSLDKNGKQQKSETGPPYKRPRGAAPKGKEWNTDTGEWNTKEDDGHDGVNAGNPQHPPQAPPTE